MYSEKRLRDLKMARRIMYRREELGYTREQLAWMCGISTSFLHDVEYGMRGISTNTLLKLCKYLEVPADYLLRNTPKFDMAEDETYEIKERIVDFMCDLTAKELEALEQICHIYVDCVRAKRPKRKNV